MRTTTKFERKQGAYAMLDRIIEKHTASPRNDPGIVNYSMREYKEKEGGKKDVPKRCK